MLRFFVTWMALFAAPFTLVAKDFLSVVAVMQNEGRWLAEWIEYHAMLGVDHFYLYDDQSTDNTKEVLQPYVKRGIVTVQPAPKCAPEDSEYIKGYPLGQRQQEHLQRTIYGQACKELAGKTKWLAIIDCDEYITPIAYPDLVTFLREFDDCVGVQVNWVAFGTSRCAEIPADRLCIESLKRRAPLDCRGHRFTKSIVRPDWVSFAGVHHSLYRDGMIPVDTDKEPLPPQIRPKPIKMDKVRLHHYYTRDEKWYFSEKRRREERWGIHHSAEWTQTLLDLLNSEEDDAMDRFIPQLRQRMSLPPN